MSNIIGLTRSLEVSSHLRHLHTLEFQTLSGFLFTDVHSTLPSPISALRSLSSAPPISSIGSTSAAPATPLAASLLRLSTSPPFAAATWAHQGCPVVQGTRPRWAADLGPQKGRPQADLEMPSCLPSFRNASYGSFCGSLMFLASLEKRLQSLKQSQNSSLHLM